MVVSALPILAGCTGDGDERNMVIEFSPGEYEGDFPTNPFKGFLAWGESPDLENYTQQWSMIYARMYWREIEPVKGEFAWREFEDNWNFDKAAGNRKIVLRVVLDNPNEHLEGSAMEIPDWLFDEIDGNGTYYDSPEIGEGFSPDYSDPVLVDEHRRLISALGERYDKDPRIAFVQIGSLGHWGEWHTWPKGTGDFPRYEVAEKYVRHYAAAFKNKILMVRRPLVANASMPGLGLFNDALGDGTLPDTQSWAYWLSHGYKSEWDKASHPAMRAKWWYTACSGGELAYHPDGARHWFEDGVFDELLDQIAACHTSWIGPNGPGNIKKPLAYQEKIDVLLATLGYRFVIERVSCSIETKPGGKVDIGLFVKNTGVAPVYYRWPVEISIRAKDRTIVTTELEGVDIRKWVPGKNAAKASFRLPKDIVPGEYTLALAIVNPDTGEPGIEFANDRSHRLKDGWYKVGTFNTDSK